jgi:DNA-binding MarR family transcriptional regulator
VSATHGSTATRGDVRAGDAEGGNVLAGNVLTGNVLAGDAEGQDKVVTAWREMAACHAAACAALERELGERHGLGVSDFEVLERLAESDGRKFRAQDLAEAVHLSQSALSRLVDRLARHGLVERCGCDVDRRGIYVVLTEAGERRHAEAVPTHRGILARHLPASMLGTQVPGTQYRAASSGG